MDRWSEEQCKKMEKGGNNKAREFLQSQPDFLPTLPITQKYHTRAAALYREKLACVCDGRTFDPSTVQWTPPSQPQKQPQQQPETANDGFTMPSKKQNEEYFARLGNENAYRSETLPPSKGGKYAGFGSSPMSSSTDTSQQYNTGAPNLQTIVNDPLSALSMGWSFVSSTASVALGTVGQAVTRGAEIVNESVIKPGMERARDPNFQSGVQDTVGKGITGVGNILGQVGKKAFDTTSKALQYIDPDAGYTRSSDQGRYQQVQQGDTRDDFFAQYDNNTVNPNKPNTSGNVNTTNNDQGDWSRSQSPAQQHPSSARPSSPTGQSSLTSVSTRKGRATVAPAAGEDEWDKW